MLRPDPEQLFRTARPEGPILCLSVAASGQQKRTIVNFWDFLTAFFVPGVKLAGQREPNN
tara:strand:+ start:2081 stop:2260 length:180 start_codon:yes stop_codon:yes gene_type:complete